MITFVFIEFFSSHGYLWFTPNTLYGRNDHSLCAIYVFFYLTMTFDFLLPHIVIPILIIDISYMVFCCFIFFFVRVSSICFIALPFVSFIWKNAFNTSQDVIKDCLRPWGSRNVHWCCQECYHCTFAWFKKCPLMLSGMLSFHLYLYYFHFNPDIFMNMCFSTPFLKAWPLHRNYRETRRLGVMLFSDSCTFYLPLWRTTALQVRSCRSQKES